MAADTKKADHSAQPAHGGGSSASGAEDPNASLIDAVREENVEAAGASGGFEEDPRIPKSKVGEEVRPRQPSGRRPP